MPCHHALSEMLPPAAIADDRKGWLFRPTPGQNATALTELPMNQSAAWFMVQSGEERTCSLLTDAELKRFNRCQVIADRLKRKTPVANLDASRPNTDEKDLAVLQKVHDGDVLFRSSDNDERQWIVAYNSPTDPGATYLYDRATGAVKFLYRPRPWFKPPNGLVDMQPVKFQSRGHIRFCVGAQADHEDSFDPLNTLFLQDSLSGRPTCK